MSLPCFARSGRLVPKRSLGPATTAPDVTTHVGSVSEVVVIRGPKLDDDRERPSVWTDLPSWVTSADL